jgi:PPK2 family polyphosphate:nucleotide phosphotransferase
MKEEGGKTDDGRWTAVDDWRKWGGMIGCIIDGELKKPKGVLMGGRTSKRVAEVSVNESGDGMEAQARAEVIATPEEAVESSPQPDYPRYRVEPGKKVKLKEMDPDESEHYTSKGDVKAELKKQRKRIVALQERLYAENKQSLLIVIQAMDTGGKDGTIRGVFQGVNPQGCQVWSFKVPSIEEAEHDFLWRYHYRTPTLGMITIFNRSHYEDVLVVRVKKLAPEKVWRPRYEMINQFEQMLTQNNTTVLKFYLHISKDEQKRRLQKRLDNPNKQWKFSVGDLDERKRWDAYQAAFEEAINRCSTEYAPWYTIPANKKWYRNLVVARTIADTLEAMNPRFPKAERGLGKVEIRD